MSGIWLPRTEHHNIPAVAHGKRIGTHGIVLHDTEGSLSSALATFESPAEGGVGAHLVIGTNRCVQLTDLRNKCWHAVAANTYMIGIEHAGFAAWTRERWLHNGQQIDMSAKRAAWILREFHLGLPVLHKNIFRHSDGGVAWGGHHDPGAGFPMDVWLNKCHHYYETRWGR